MKHKDYALELLKQKELKVWLNRWNLDKTPRKYLN